MDLQDDPADAVDPTEEDFEDVDEHAAPPPSFRKPDRSDSEKKATNGDLNGSDAECYMLLSQLRARETADAIAWEDENFDNGMQEKDAQRLGCGDAPPPPTLDKEEWDSIINVEGMEDMEDIPMKNAEDPEMGGDGGVDTSIKKIVTLSAVFAQIRVGNSNLTQDQSHLLWPVLWRCLVNLRDPANIHLLPNPRNFFQTNKKLNWHQLCEREAALVRLIAGMPAKRTSRAAAWRALSASLVKACDWEAVSEIATGMVVLYVPPNHQQWQVGLVLTVWRCTATKGSKPSPFPISKEIARCFRVAQMTAMENHREGTYRASAKSEMVVCAGYRAGLVLQVSETMRGVDGVQVVLTDKSLEAVQTAHEWTQWPKDMMHSIPAYTGGSKTSKFSKRSKRTFIELSEISRSVQAEMEAPDIEIVDGEDMESSEKKVKKNDGLETGPEDPEGSKGAKGGRGRGDHLSRKLNKGLIKHLHEKAQGAMGKKTEEIPVFWIFWYFWLFMLFIYFIFFKLMFLHDFQIFQVFSC